MNQIWAAGLRWLCYASIPSGREPSARLPAATPPFPGPERRFDSSTWQPQRMCSNIRVCDLVIFIFLLFTEQRRNVPIVKHGARPFWWNCAEENTQRTALPQKTTLSTSLKS